MFEYISGQLAEKKPTSIVVDVQGVGYHLQVPLSTFSALPEEGKKVKILTHFVVREDAQVLYGFSNRDERHLFRLLISVSGIGPKMALMILSGRSHDELKQAIVEGSIAFLTGITGIGKKTAERLIVELREKISIQNKEKLVISGKTNLSSLGAAADDSLSALIELGYKKQSAEQAIEKALKENKDSKLSVPELIRASLQYV